MKRLAALAVMLAAGSANGAQPAEGEKTLPPSQLPCAEPVRRAPVRFPPKLLAGPGSQAAMFSGYVNVTEKDFLFYWFVEAEADAGPDAPIVVWSNGGPGCSAMEGATTEIGPLVMFKAKVAGSGAFDGKLTRNPYAWNQRAHLLFVDQPRYVGFSTGTGPEALTSEQAGLDMVEFLRGWRHLFPERRRSHFILASESFGGRFVPAWASAIFTHNEQVSYENEIRIAGLAIGNGFMDGDLQGLSSFVEWAKDQKLLAEGESPEDEDEARRMIKHNIGYVPNVYDYRLVDAGDCCGCFGYNYSAWSNWLLEKTVTSALNVCGDAGYFAFSGCSGGCIEFTQIFDGDAIFDAASVLERALNLGIPTSLFYGMQDTSCNYKGGYEVALSLQWSGAKDWAAAALEPLRLSGATVGSIQSAGGLTFMQIEGAGHMTPVDNPSAASFVLDHLVKEINARRGRPHVLIQKDQESVGLNVGPGKGTRAQRLNTAPAAILAVCLTMIGAVSFAMFRRRLPSRAMSVSPGGDCQDADDEPFALDEARHMVPI